MNNVGADNRSGGRRRIIGIVAITLFFATLILLFAVLSGRFLASGTSTPQPTQQRPISVSYQVKDKNGKTTPIEGVFGGETDTSVTVITQVGQSMTIPRRDVVKQTCDTPQPAGDCPINQSVSISRGSIDGALIFETLGIMRIRTALGEQVDVFKLAVARNGDNTLRQDRTPSNCEATPEGACTIKLVLKADDSHNQVSGILLSVTPDQFVVQTVPQTSVTIEKADIVKVDVGPRLTGVVTPVGSNGSDIIDAATASGGLPKGGAGPSVIITVQNAGQLKPLVKAPLHPPYFILQQIIWQRDREIEAVFYTGNIWIYRPDTLDAQPRRIDWNSPLGEVTLSPDGKLIAAAGMDPNTYSPLIKVWDIASGQPPNMFKGALRVEFSLDGQYLAGSSGRGLGFWNVNTGKVDRTIPDAGFSTKAVLLPLIRFSPDGKLIASTSADGTVGLWDAVGGKITLLVKQQAGPASKLQFSPDGKLLAGRIDKRIQLWNAATGDSVALLEGHTGDVMDISFSPDGSLLASVGIDKTIRLWEVATGKLLTTLTMDGDSPVYSVAFSPDGSRLATGGNALWFWAVPQP